MHYVVLSIFFVFSVILTEVIAFFPIHFLAWLWPTPWLVLTAIALVLAWFIGD